MLGKPTLLACVLALVAACAVIEEPWATEDSPATEANQYSDEEPLTLFRIGPSEVKRIPVRMLNTINELRGVEDLGAVILSSNLSAAAATHSWDMAVQNRPWHFGSDGSSVLDRAETAGFEGRVLGENIAETFEDDLQTLAAWLEHEDTRATVMDPEARQIGVGWHQQENGKIWWTLVVGT